MCTSLTYKSSDDIYFLARTMDFGFELEGMPVFIPEHFSWEMKSGGRQITRYSFIGTGRDLDGYLLADGMNEHGLCIAELYHPGEASYHDEAIYGKVNLAPFELPLWILGELKSVSELRSRVQEINLMNMKNVLLDAVPPLHYIIMDQSGEQVVIEVTDGVLMIKENPVGVMTNSPDFEWHLKNLNNYIYLQPVNFPDRTVGGLNLAPFGQASGTFGLPGGFTSPERFVRTVFMKHSVRPAGNAEEAVNTLIKILNSVTIPRGISISNDGADNYTQYIAFFNATERIYYFRLYGSNEIFAFRLTNSLIRETEPLIFLVEEKMDIRYTYI